MGRVKTTDRAEEISQTNHYHQNINNIESTRYDQRSMFISTGDITSEFDLFYLKSQCISLKQVSSFQVSC